MKRFLCALVAAALFALPASAVNPLYQAQQQITQTAPAAPGSAAGGVTSGDLGAFVSGEIVCSSAGNTGGSLNIFLQSSRDSGTTWTDYIAFPQLAAAAASTTWRVSVTKQSVPNAIQVVGLGVLTANTVSGGEWGDRLRLYATSGAATTVGATITCSLTFSLP